MARHRFLLALSVALLLGLLPGCAADPCDPLAPGDPCDPSVGPVTPCAGPATHRAKLRPKWCSLWRPVPDPCGPGPDPESDACYVAPASP
ncbi:MAG: hypothetical protein ACC662_05950 [Planctomycetota bacterium]